MHGKFEFTIMACPKEKKTAFSHQNLAKKL